MFDSRLPKLAISPRNCTISNLERPDIQNSWWACPQAPLGGCTSNDLILGADVVSLSHWTSQKFIPTGLGSLSCDCALSASNTTADYHTLELSFHWWPFAGEKQHLSWPWEPPHNFMSQWMLPYWFTVHMMSRLSTIILRNALTTTHQLPSKPGLTL